MRPPGWLRISNDGSANLVGFPSAQTLSPVERVPPTPGKSGLEQSIARLDEIVCRGEIVGRVRNQRIPSVTPRPRLRCAHQPQLQTASAVLCQNADATKIAGIGGVRRGNYTGEADRCRPMKREPPMSEIERRNRRAIEECEAMQLCQNFRNFLFRAVNFANPVHGLDLRNKADLRRSWKCTFLMSGPLRETRI